MHRGSTQRRTQGAAPAAGRGVLVLLAAALLLLGGPVGVAAAHCHGMPGGHSADTAGSGHHADDSAHDASGASPTSQVTASSPPMPSWCAQQCIDTAACLDAANTATAAPSASPSPQVPLAPVRRVPPPTAFSSDAAAVGVVPPWTHPALDRLEILRI